MVSPKPINTGWDRGAGSGVDRILPVDCLGGIRSFCLVDIGWALDGRVELGATVRFDEVLVEAGRAGVTVDPGLTIEEGRKEVGVALTFPRPPPSSTARPVPPPLPSTRAASSIGLKETTEAEVLKCRFELL
jgi:hypothetical protein